ncbi:MAG: hypothetical protein AAGA88_12270 [Pseudomonadota bacterium]
MDRGAYLDMVKVHFDGIWRKFGRPLGLAIGGLAIGGHSTPNRPHPMRQHRISAVLTTDCRANRQAELTLCSSKGL